MKINKKYTPVIMATIMSFMMALFMSFVMVAVNIGFPKLFFVMWIRGFGIGIVVALPLSFIVMPISKKIANRLTK